MIKFLGSVELQTTDSWEMKHHIARWLAKLTSGRNIALELLLRVGERMSIAHTPGIHLPPLHVPRPHREFSPVKLSSKSVVPDSIENFSFFIDHWRPVAQMADGACLRFRWKFDTDVVPPQLLPSMVTFNMLNMMPRIINHRIHQYILRCRYIRSQFYISCQPSR